jgi:exopolysaccharide biosynthesis polyprenyl glycosylphosphotransferase
MKRFEMYFTLARIPLDFTAALVAWHLARMIRPITDLIPGLHSWFDPKFIPDLSFFLPFSLFAAFGYVLIAAFFGLFRFSEESNWSKEIPRVLLSSLFWGMAIISFFAIAYREVIFSRIMLAQAMVFVVFFVLLFHLLLDATKKYSWQKGFGVHRIILLGTPKNRKRFADVISQLPQFSLAGQYSPDEKYSLDVVEELWFVDGNITPEMEKTLHEKCHAEHKTFRFLPSSSETFARMELNVVGGLPLLKPVPASLSGWGQVLKRFLDIFGSAVALVILLPVFFLLAIGVKSTSAGPVFYGSKRIGRKGKEFIMWKFRSMVCDAERRKKELVQKNHRSDSPFFKVKNDPRITPFGRFLRRFSLDELPQLWNVMRGEMSLIGSRPHLPEEIAQFTPEKKRILSIKPGLTGLAQVSGRSDLSFADEIRLDTYYLENWSFWLDLKIALKTVWVIIKGEGAD